MHLHLTKRLTNRLTVLLSSCNAPKVVAALYSADISQYCLRVFLIYILASCYISYDVLSVYSQSDIHASSYQ